MSVFFTDKPTEEQNKHISVIYDRLESAGWKPHHIQQWFQTPMHEFGGKTPIDAIAMQSYDLLERCCDKTLRLYEKAINESSR